VICADQTEIHNAGALIPLYNGDRKHTADFTDYLIYADQTLVGKTAGQKRIYV
jgi:hypothetical protein